MFDMSVVRLRVMYHRRRNHHLNTIKITYLHIPAIIAVVGYCCFE